MTRVRKPISTMSDRDESSAPRPAGFDLACLGEPMLELNQRHGESGGGRVYLEAHGGDASNVAIAAARQGAKVAMITAVGDDPAGRSFLDLWTREDVATDAIRVDAENPTGVYFVSHDASGHSFSYLRRGSAASRYRLDATGRGVLEAAHTVFASGISLAISDTAADTVFEAMASARGAGHGVAFDTNYRPKLWPRHRAAGLIREAIRASDIVFPGIEDADLLFGLSQPDAVVDLCLSLGPSIVVLKMGSAGALLATPDRRFTVAPFPCVPVDATGAGDAFCGSFLARRAAGGSLDDAAHYAACAAALSTIGYGAVPPIPRRAAVLAALGTVDEAWIGEPA